MSASEFSKLVFDISQKLSRENVEALKYLYKAYYPENATNLGVLTALENRGVFSSRNIEGLRVLLCDIHRCDLLELLKAAEDKRLQLCYYQAMSIEKQLEMIRTELENFCSKHEECSPTDRHFCGKITDRVEKVQREMREYLTTPLKEVCAASHSKAEAAPPSKILGYKTNASDGSKTIGTFPHSHSVTNFSTQASSSHGRQSPAITQHKLAVQQQREDTDYDTLSPAVEQREHRSGRSSRQQLDRTRQEGRGVVATGDSGVRRMQCAATSMPNVTYVPVHGHSSPKRRHQYRSNSVENLAASSSTQLSSHIPIPNRSLRLSGKTLRKSNSGESPYGGSDVDMSGSGGTGDSGFCDPTEFLKMEEEVSSNGEHHVYMKPSKLTANAPSTYTVPAPLKNKRHRIDSSNSVLS